MTEIKIKRRLKKDEIDYEKETITFEMICEKCIYIKRLYNAAKMIGKMRRFENFCANIIWYDVFKPQLIRHIGWCRKSYYEFENNVDLDKYPYKHKKSILDTSKAYDIAYHKIYHALPDCNHEDICC